MMNMQETIVSAQYRGLNTEVIYGFWDFLQWPFDRVHDVMEYVHDDIGLSWAGVII